MILGVFGHEFVGVVEEIDTEFEHLVGQRVVGDINLACGKCSNCSRGDVILARNHCSERVVLGILNKDGVHADYVTISIANLHPVPAGVTNEQAVFVEPLAAAFRIVEQKIIQPGDNVAVIGDGKLGLLIAKVLQSQPNGGLTLFGKHSNKLDLIDESDGAIEKVLVNKEAPEKFDSLFDVVVEASGSPSGLMMASSFTRPLGTVVLKSTCASGDKEFNSAPFVVKELKVIGSRCGNFPMALEALEKKQIHVDNLLEKSYHIANAVEAFEHAKVRGTLKIQLIMEK